MDKLQVIADYSMDQLAHDQTGHGSDHTKRVVKLAEKILETEPQADRFVTLAAATYMIRLMIKSLKMRTRQSNSFVYSFALCQ